MFQERLNDAAIALHRVFSRSQVPFAIFGGYAIGAMGGVRESKDVDCLAAVSKKEAIRLLHASEGFQYIPQHRQDCAAFFWSDNEDRTSAVLVKVFCEQFPGSKYTMHNVHGTLLPIHGHALGQGVSSFLDPFRIFKGKLRAAASRSTYRDSADLRLLGSQYELHIRQQAHELDPVTAGLCLQRYPELELLMHRLHVDVPSAQKAVKDGDRARSPEPQPGEVQEGLLG